MDLAKSPNGPWHVFSIFCKLGLNIHGHIKVRTERKVLIPMHLVLSFEMPFTSSPQRKDSEATAKSDKLAAKRQVHGRFQDSIRFAELCSARADSKILSDSRFQSSDQPSSSDASPSPASQSSAASSASFASILLALQRHIPARQALTGRHSKAESRLCLVTAWNIPVISR